VPADAIVQIRPNPLVRCAFEEEDVLTSLEKYQDARDEHISFRVDALISGWHVLYEKNLSHSFC
jgi:hypothetical protein